MTRYHVFIKEIGGEMTEIWCGDETIDRVKKLIETIKREGRLRIAKIYRYEGRKQVLEKVIRGKRSRGDHDNG